MNFVFLWRKLYKHTLWFSYVIFMFTRLFSANVFDEILYYITFLYSIVTLPYMMFIHMQSKKIKYFNFAVNLAYPIAFAVLKILSFMNGGVRNAVTGLVMSSLLLGFGVFNFIFFRNNYEILTEFKPLKENPKMRFFKFYTYVVLPLLALGVFSNLGIVFVSSTAGAIWTFIFAIYIYIIIRTIIFLHKRKIHGLILNTLILILNPIVILVFIASGFMMISSMIGGSADVVANLYDMMPFVYPECFISVLIFNYFYDIRAQFRNL